MGDVAVRDALPANAEAFDSVDALFKAEMADAALTPSALEACLAPGRGALFARYIYIHI